MLFIWATGLLIGLLVGQNYEHDGVWSTIILVFALAIISYQVFSTTVEEYKRKAYWRKTRKMLTDLGDSVRMASTAKLATKRQTLSGKIATDDVKERARQLFVDEVGGDWDSLPEPGRENFYRAIEEDDAEKSQPAPVGPTFEESVEKVDEAVKTRQEEFDGLEGRARAQARHIGLDPSTEEPGDESPVEEAELEQIAAVEEAEAFPEAERDPEEGIKDMPEKLRAVLARESINVASVVKWEYIEEDDILKVFYGDGDDEYDNIEAEIRED